MFRKVNRESTVVEESASVVEAVSFGDVEAFAAAERAAVEKAEAELNTALDARGRLTHELEAERDRQLREDFDGERIVEFEKRIAVAGKAIERARNRLSIATEGLREKRAEHRRLLEARYRRAAEARVEDLHRKLEEARRASEHLVDLHDEAETTLGTGQRVVPRGIWFAAILDPGDAGDGGPVARWRRYAGRRLAGEE